MNKTFEVELWDEKHILTIPDLPLDSILPGAFRGDMLALFNSFLGNHPLKTMEECAADRDAHKEHWWEWAEAHYTWNHLLREGPHLGVKATARLTKMMFDRDLNCELNGGLLDTGKEPNWRSIFGMPKKEDYFATLIITAARYAWWNRVQKQGLPDPKVDPMPPIYQADRIKVGKIYNQQIKPFLSEHITSRGYNREFPVLTALILYVLGYIAERPGWLDIPAELWYEALQGFIRPPHAPFIWMLHYPGEYLNAIAEEGHEGKHNGFFSTPTPVTCMMAEMLGDSQSSSIGSGHYKMEDGLWVCTIPGKSADERRAVLEQRVSDPCVGGGNMIWGFINQWVFGEFIDINPALVNATKAMCAMYTPWFFDSILQANALSYDPTIAEEQENAQRAYRQGILEQIRAERTLGYYISQRAGEYTFPHRASSSLQFAHMEARAQARLAERRKIFIKNIHGDKLEILQTLLEKGAAAAEPKEKPRSASAYDDGAQLPLFR